MRKVLALAFVAALFMFACGSSEPTDTASGDQTPADQETADALDVSGMDEADIEVDDFYFAPNVIQGEAGQTVTLTLENEGDAEHNFTLEDQKIDEDIEPGDDVKVEVTFPESGSLEFHCEYHAGQGMTGSLEVAG
jgi:plastocyanin